MSFPLLFAADRHCPLFIPFHFKISQVARAQRTNEIQIPRIPSALPLSNEICHSHSRPRRPSLQSPNSMCDKSSLSIAEAKKYAPTDQLLGDATVTLLGISVSDFTVPCKGLYLTAEIAQSEEANGVDRGSGQTNMWGEREDHTFRGLATEQTAKRKLSTARHAWV